MKRSLLLSFSFLFSILFFSFTGEQDPLRKKYAETITAADLKKYLSVIASDEYEGRETGKKGQHMTAEYIANQFMSFGIPGLPGTSQLDPIAKNYFQNVPLLQLQPGNGTVSTAMSTFKFGNDFYYTAGIEDQVLKTDKIVFAGYGIQDSLYKDYDGIDVSGKTVMILSDEPIDKNGNSIITGKKDLSTWSTARRRKSNEAKSKNAAALLIVVDDFQNRYAQNKKYISGSTLQLDEATDKKEVPGMPVLYISREMADRLLKEGKQKKTIDNLVKSISKKKSPKHIQFDLGIGIDIQRLSEKINSENVLGYIEGTDLKNELLVITAHMDHLGIDTTREGDKVFNGADDDGSGTVSVIELAHAFALAKKDGHGPRRSILFMCVTGEEKGLLGSKWYTDHPVFPLANTVVDLNTDMIGRVDPAHEKDTNYVYVIGSDKLSSELKNINETNNNTYIKMVLDYRYDVPNEPNNFYGRSDHYNFAKNNIPIAFFFDGIHADYHKVTDEVSKINFTLMEKRSRLVFYDAWEIANRDQRLVVDAKKSK
jgi:hypothetical protein